MKVNPFGYRTSRQPEKRRETIKILVHEFLHFRLNLQKSTSYNSFYDTYLGELLGTLFWKFTEASGKIIGCQYWSSEAIKMLESIYSAEKPNKSLLGSKLRHEHLTPRKVMCQYLFSLSSPTLEDVSLYLDKHCIGVIITREEDAMLTKCGLRSKVPENSIDPWDRYKHNDLNIPVVSPTH